MPVHVHSVSEIDNVVSAHSFVRTVTGEDCWFLRTRLADFYMEWLVDSGANPNVIARRHYLRIPESRRSPLEPIDMILTAANGDEIVVYGQTTIQIKIDEAQFQVSCVVADIGNTAGILGMSFLRKEGLAVYFGTGWLVKGDRKWKFVGSGGSSDSAVKLLNDVHVPPYHAVVTEASINNFREMEFSGEALLEPDGYLSAQTHVAVPRGLVSIGGPNRSKVSVSLTNFTNIEVKLSAGTTLGMLHGVSLEPLMPLTKSVNSASSGSKSSLEIPSHLKEMIEEAGKGLNEEQKPSLKSVIASHINAFAAADGSLRSTDLVQHCIDTGSARPFKVPYRPPGFARKEIFDENVKKMTQNAELVRPVSKLCLLESAA